MFAMYFKVVNSPPPMLANQSNKAHDDVHVWIFLMADVSICATPGQVTPMGYYNIEWMLRYSINKGAEVKIFGSCAGSRGIKDQELIEGTKIGSMAELTQWITDSDKVISF